MPRCILILCLRCTISGYVLLISDSAPAGGQHCHVTSVGAGFGPARTRTCTPANTEATSIEECNASSKLTLHSMLLSGHIYIPL